MVFSEGYASADDWIIKECQSRPRQRQLAIVSSDREIQLAARRAKAEIISSDSFIAELYTQTDLNEDEEEDLRSTVRREPPTDVLEVKRDPALKQPGISDSELSEFREAMKKSEEPELPGDPPQKNQSPRSPNDVPGLKKEIRDENQMDDFYRQMRDWENRGR